MNKLHILFVYVQREAFSDFSIGFQRMPAYWIIFSYVDIRGATIYRYTGKPRFTRNKYRIAIHF